MGRRPGIIISSSIYAGDLLIAQTEQTSKSDFDLSAWENLNGYRYDKFEKAWVYQRNYVKYYDDANLIISIYCSGNDEGITVFPAIVLRLIDLTDNSASGRSAYFMYTGMSILIGDDLYNWPVLYQKGIDSYAHIYEANKDFLKKFAEAEPDSIAIRLYVDDLHYDYDSEDWDSSFIELQEGCKEVYNCDPWSNSILYDEVKERFESEYPMEYVSENER